MAAEAIAHGLQGADGPLRLPAGPLAEPHRPRSRCGRVAQEAGLPIVFHVGGGGRLLDPNYFENGLPLVTDFHGGAENFRSVDYMAIPYPPMQTLATMIFDRVLDHFPRLKIGVIEQGAVWVPSWMRQMESALEAFAKTEERLRQLALRPSEYVRRQIRVTPVPDRAGRLDHRAGRRGGLPVLLRLSARRRRPQPDQALRGQPGRMRRRRCEAALLLRQLRRPHGSSAGLTLLSSRPTCYIIVMSERYPSDSGYTVDQYFDLVRQGVLAEDDRVELLEGIIVAEPPMDPPHASGVSSAAEALRRAVAGRAVVREDKPLVLGDRSVPEPDVAVVPGRPGDYSRRHPTAALLIVEVSDSSLKQDRLSKSRIYAAAGCPEYWIVNVRDDQVEVFRVADPAQRIYAERSVAQRGERIALVAFPDAAVAVDELLPWPPRPRDDAF